MAYLSHMGLNSFKIFKVFDFENFLTSLWKVIYEFSVGEKGSLWFFVNLSVEKAWINNQNFEEKKASSNCIFKSIFNLKKIYIFDYFPWM